jgi:hypothetical protein
MTQVRTRKGIYQTFSAQDDVIADERWRCIPTTDGGWRIDTETVRIVPAEEPRNESIMLELDARWNLRRLVIYALRERRECQARVSVNTLDYCWRADDSSTNHTFPWLSDCEIDYNSALFKMVTLRRVACATEPALAFRVLRLNPVTFEPGWTRQRYQCMGEELHNTRFGAMTLTRYQISADDALGDIGDVWCDASGLVYESIWNGGCTRLVAVNLPGESNL